MTLDAFAGEVDAGIGKVEGVIDLPVLHRMHHARQLQDRPEYPGAVYYTHLAVYKRQTYYYSGYPMVRELRRLIAEGHLGHLQQIHIEICLLYTSRCV